jgi:hypothetical protein
MGFESPIYFWALAGLLFPLLIHLWNRKLGKRVQTGSIRWLKSSKSSRISSLRFTQWLLFLLRAGILVLFAALLAQPFINDQKKADVKKLVLVQPELTTYQAVKDQLDSLQRQNFDIRLFKAGFPHWQQQIKYTSESATDYWGLLQQAGKRFAVEDTLWVYATTSARNFTGSRPAVGFNVQWVSLPSDESLTFLAKAKRTASDSLKVLYGSSSSDGIDFYYKTVKWTDAPLRFQLNSGQQVEVLADADSNFWKARLEGGNELKITKEKTLSVDLYATKAFQTEKRYIQAALKALERYTHRPIELKVLKEPRIREKAVCWLFWLSDESLPDSLRSEYVSVLSYHKNASELKPLIHRVDNGYVLSRRLDPEQNAKALQEPLAAMLRQMLFEQEQVMALADKHDLREMPLRQVLPQARAQQQDTKEVQKQGLHFYGWLLLMILFVLERYFSVWKQK